MAAPGLEPVSVLVAGEKKLVSLALFVNQASLSCKSLLVRRRYGVTLFVSDSPNIVCRSLRGYALDEKERRS
jgi:hypothetical protein